MLGPKIEGLPDDYRSKPRCLFDLSRLFYSVGNNTEYRLLFIHVLKLWRERGDGLRVTDALNSLLKENRELGLHEEVSLVRGIPCCTAPHNLCCNCFTFLEREPR